MKTSKKLVSLLLTLALIFAMSSTAFADGPTTYTITINNTATGHTYEAYQVFSGDLSNSTLSNIQWGSGVNGDDLLAALKADTTIGSTFTDATTAADVADAISGGTNDSALMKQFAQIVGQHLSTTATGTSTQNTTTHKYDISNLSAGYYLVKDQAGSLAGDPDSYTKYIVKVVGNVETNPKSDVPTVEKKVKDINNSTDTAYSGWQDSADHDVGDKVPFQLKATLPSNVSSYSSYKVIFHDTLSSGLTYDAGSMKVYVGGVDKTGQFTIDTTAQSDGSNLTVSCSDVKAAAVGATDGSVITVEYTATLNTSAVIGSAGNPNKVYLEYSNNPNSTGEGETGNTPEDKVIVFTYKTIVNKTDGTNALTGAEFKLEKQIKAADKTTSWSEVPTASRAVKSNNGTTFTFSGLDDGNYRLTETTTPPGYNTITPIEFTISATHDTTADNPTLTALTGGNSATGLVMTPVIADGSLSTTVVNHTGSTLPSTGAMGTTMLYIIGGILVAATAVILITKKRMTKES